MTDSPREANGGRPARRAVRGHILFDGEVPPLDDAVVHVFLEDTTQIDASAVVVVHQQFSPVGPSGSTLTFALPDVLVDERSDYSLRVLVDMDHDGRISSGDYISVRAHPVLTRGHAEHVPVRVRRVT